MKKVKTKYSNYLTRMVKIIFVTFLILSYHLNCSFNKKAKSSFAFPEEDLKRNKEDKDTIKNENIENSIEPIYLKPPEWQGLFFVVLEKVDFLKSNGYNLYLCKREMWKTTSPDLEWSLENHRIRVEKIRGDTLLVEQVVPDTNNEWMITFLHLPTNKKIYGYTHKQALQEVVLLKDIENAEKRWKGKTVFSKRGIISVIEKKETFTLTTKKIKITDSLTVTGVKAGLTPFPVKPIWLIVTNKEGVEGIIPIRYSWTNTMIDQIKEEKPWEEDIFESNPLSIYKWEDNIWELINNHRVIIGMTEEQVKLSWGSPDSILIENRDKSIEKVWHYPSHIVIFSNGNVFSIREKKIK